MTVATAEQLQELLDDPSPVCDLGGGTFDAFDVRIETEHSGKVIQNGTINILPNANIGNIKFIQGKWNYPAGRIDVTFRNVLFNGGFDHNDGLQKRNEEVADTMGRGANAVTTITNKAGRVEFTNCSFSNLGNSAIAGSFDELIVNDCQFKRVAKHCIGVRQFGGSKVSIDGVIATECGNVLDLHGDGTIFHGDGTIFPTADIAKINNVSVFDSTGRSKISGSNWDAEITNWNATQSNVVNLNLFPAFDLARNPRAFVARQFTSVNYPTCGFGSLTDSNPPGLIGLSDVFIRNSLSGIKVQQRMSVIDSEFEVNHRFRSGAPFMQTNNVDLVILSDQYWADIFDGINNLYAAKNAEWGTAYVPAFWLPLSVRNLMTTK